MIVYTIGHSTRTEAEFLETLHAYEIELLADVRTVPKSRHTPQFHIDNLSRTLPARGIDYRHFSALGGLRHAKKDSTVNAGWRNASFRGYADYMQTSEFAEGIAELMRAASEKRTAIMCAEAVPWRCHRSMVGDALLVRGVEVRDIFSDTDWRAEKVTPFAVVDGTTITYPAEQ
ncbi:DUF488 family protein [Ruicaihuangia caeni]|uniref:DUF488 domain-containing protein n=1 Tax=Ruicaihuangia caeni TaxID=3042517 RepID=A0AAW6T6Y4_9MICO|nr:DUF488 domain-containing protein [Klugiella sp. YN-L-19]MDI2099269.1 DUF488 domain-containing protein [Klugiella sp. YN-L-19]